ncbi:hypothetical protein O1L44_10380 [Streptomyces noursei]|nr:hypothetical protein [Streptomyces noursei]
MGAEGDAAAPVVVRTDGIAAVIELSDVVPDAPSDVNGAAGTGR